MEATPTEKRLVEVGDVDGLGLTAALERLRLCSGMPFIKKEKRVTTPQPLPEHPKRLTRIRTPRIKSPAKTGIITKPSIISLRYGRSILKTEVKQKEKPRKATEAEKAQRKIVRLERRRSTRRERKNDLLMASLFDGLEIGSGEGKKKKKAVVTRTQKRKIIKRERDTKAAAGEVKMEDMVEIKIEAMDNERAGDDMVEIKIEGMDNEREEDDVVDIKVEAIDDDEMWMVV